MTLVDIVVPVCNEEENVRRFVEQIRNLQLPENVELRIAFIEDGSRDATPSVLRELSTDANDVFFYSLRKGFGQGPAVIFGLSRSEADASVMMDVDGTHDPVLLPGMIQAFLEGAQVVQGIRETLVDRTPFRRAASSAFRLVVSLITGGNWLDQNVYYRLVSRSFRERILETPRWWRFLRVVLPPEGEGLAVIRYHAAERDLGESQYPPLRLAMLALDGLLSLVSPLRFAFLSVLGIALLGALVLWGGWLGLVVSLAFGVGYGALTIRYAGLQSSRVLGRMEVVASG